MAKVKFGKFEVDDGYIPVPRDEQVKKAIDKIIRSQVKGLGYDNENSIAKYLVVGNRYYDECKALSLWIGDVWDYVNGVKRDVDNKIISEPTMDVLISGIPPYQGV